MQDSSILDQTRGR
jgi:hypothetical protein